MEAKAVRLKKGRFHPWPVRGRVCLVTGATSGIGLETARALAAMGATVIVGARDRERGERARADIQASTGSTDAHVVVADFSRLREVRAMALEVLDRFPRLHVLVNNAGLLMGQRLTTEDGLELTFQVNYAAHFLLTELLLGRLKASAPSRVVNVASEAHRWGRIDFDDLQSERHWSGVKAYAQSKYANIVFTYELAHRLEGTGVTANAVHPGVVATGWTRHASPWMRMYATLGRPFMLSARRGAQTVVWLAASPEVERATGGYYRRRKPIRSVPASYGLEVQRRLWETTRSLVGLELHG